MQYYDDDDIEDPPVEVSHGSVQGSAGADLLSEGLLISIQEVAKLQVLLSEADEDEFRAIHSRLKAFVVAVNKLPLSPRPRKRLGFKKGRK